MDYVAMLNGPHGAYLVSTVGVCVMLGAFALAIPALSKNGCKEVGEHLKEMKEGVREDFRELKESLREDSKDMRESMKDVSKSLEKLAESQNVTNGKIVEALTNLRIDIATNDTNTNASSQKRAVHRFKRSNLTGQL